MTTPLITVTPEPAAINATGPTAAWSRRVRRIGGFIQAAFAAFWLARASLAIGGRTGDVLIAMAGVAVIGVFAYAIKVSAGTAPRPSGAQAWRIERSMSSTRLRQVLARANSMRRRGRSAFCSVKARSSLWAKSSASRPI